MRPETTAPWRKELRREAKGVGTGRRRTHRAMDDAFRVGSTWLRRHIWMPDAKQVYLAEARKQRRRA